MRYDDLTDYTWLQWEVIENEAPQAMALGLLLLQRWGRKSVIDVGCGPGIYLLPHKWRGCEIFGVDGCEGAGQSLSIREFELADLRLPWTPPKEFELSLCIEVAEHIPPGYADIFMDTLCRCAPLCFFSAAHIGQGGEGHFNEQPPSYWEQKFRERGFALDRNETNALHAVIDNDAVYSRCRWLQWHSFVFRRAI